MKLLENSILVANQANISEDVGVKPHVVTLQYANTDAVVQLLTTFTANYD